MYKLANSGWLKHFDFMVIDIFLLEAAFIISYIIRFGFSSPFATSIYAVLGVILPILHIFIVFFTEEYSGILRRGYLKEFKAVLQHNCMLVAMVTFYMFATQQSEDLFPKRALHVLGNQHRFHLAGQSVTEEGFADCVFQREEPILYVGRDLTSSCRKNDQSAAKREVQ